MAQLYRVGSVGEALELANITDYGLGSNVWTTDPAEQQRFIEGFEAGMVFVGPPVTIEPDKVLNATKAIDFIVRRDAIIRSIERNEERRPAKNAAPATTIRTIRSAMFKQIGRMV